MLKFGFSSTEFKFKSSVSGSGSTEFYFSNSVFGSGTEFKFKIRYPVPVYKTSICLYPMTNSYD